MKKHYFFLEYGTFVEPTAIEIQACIRAKLFEKYLGITPTIISKDYSSYTKHHYKQHLQSAELDTNASLLSVIDFYCDKTEPAEENNQQLFSWQANLRYEVDVNNLSNYCVFLGDTLQMYIAYNTDTRLIEYVNHIDNTDGKIKIIKRDWYDEQGYLSQIGTVNSKTNNEIIKYFLDRQGRQRVTIYYDDNQEITKVLITNEYGMTVGCFNSEEEFITDFIAKLAELHSQDEVYFITERPIYYQALRKNNHPHLHIISIVHHLQTIFNVDVMTGQFNKNFAEPFAEYLTQPHIKTVFLTDEQKNDFEQRLGSADNLYAIPNTHNYPKQAIDFNQRDRFLLTAFVRLSPEKQIDKMLEVFALVKKSIPQAKLDIYGVGDLEPKLHKQIKRLGLQKSATLKGFTDNPTQVLKTAGLSLLTSHSEAMPMTVMESLIFGCPVVSFDMKYGPASMIQDGKNGYLIPLNDIKMMAEKIIHLLNNSALHQQMSETAQSLEYDFDEQKVAEKWKELLSI